MNRLHGLINILSVIAVFPCLFINQNSNYGLLFLLPFSFFITNFFFMRNVNIMKNSFVFHIIYVQIIIRYILIPLILALTNNSFTGSNSSNGNIAIIIMVLELLGIFIVIKISAKEQAKFHTYRKGIIDYININLITSIILIFAFITLYISGFFANVSFIWALDDFIYAQRHDEFSKNSPIGVLFNPSRMILSLLLISIVIKSKKINNTSKLFFSFIVLVLNIIFIVGLSRFSIILTSIPLLFILLLYFPKKKEIVTVFLAMIIPVLLISSLSKLSRNNDMITTLDIVNLSSLNAYFSGMGNIATGIDAFQSSMDKNYHLFIVNDIFQNIPYFSNFTLDEFQTNAQFNNEIYNTFEVRDQIVPLSTSGLFHFDIFGSFLYSILFVMLALYFERKFYTATYIGYKYFYSYISLHFSLIYMLNFSVIISNMIIYFFLLFLPLTLILIFQKNANKKALLNL